MWSMIAFCIGAEVAVLCITKAHFSNIDLSIFTLWAYDATFALAMAIEKVNTTTFTYLKNTNTSNAITDLETIGTSKTGLELQRKLTSTRFRGLAGDFNLVDGQLQSSGSANGGIAAAFDETPYMSLFLGRYCSKYTMVGPVYKTAGFGFAFPRGSPLISDVSRAILKVTESDEMVQIEKAWLGTQTTCQDSSDSLTSNRIGTESFWGLFFMAGAASISAFVIYLILFLYEHRHVLVRPSPPHLSFPFAGIQTLPAVAGILNNLV